MSPPQTHLESLSFPYLSSTLTFCVARRRAEAFTLKPSRSWHPALPIVDLDEVKIIANVRTSDHVDSMDRTHGSQDGQSRTHLCCYIRRPVRHRGNSHGRKIGCSDQVSWKTVLG